MRRILLTLIAAMAFALVGTATAQARPVISGMAATATHWHPRCPYEWCVRLTFRAWEPDQYRWERLRWRALVYRFGDRALVATGMAPSSTTRRPRPGGSSHAGGCARACTSRAW